MKIAMIGQKAVPFYRDGGVETHVEALATRLAKRGHEVTVFVRRRYLATKEDIWQGVKLARVPEIPTKHFGTISSTFFATLCAVFGRCQGFPAKAWQAGVRGQRYDVIHYHGVGPSLLSWIPRLFTRAKIVVTFHSIDRFHAKWGFFSRCMLRMGEWTATHFPHVTIAVSRTIQSYCKERFGKEVHYIPNGVSVRRVSSAQHLAQWGLKKDGYILTVARLVRHKGIHTLIEAFKSIPDAVRGEMRLVIVGAPSFTSDYETYLKSIAAEDHRIVFVGYQTGEALDQLFAHCYLYAHPSESEGLSLTILEAMSFGKSVVLSNIPENLEPMDHSGIPFIVGDVPDLAEKIVSLINHPEIVSERGARGVGFIKRYFEWEKIADDTAQLYQEVVSAK